MDSDKLFNIEEKDYGDQYKNHLFEQYKLYVNCAEKISDRRQNANNYFITINTALLTFLGLSLKVEVLANLSWAKSLLCILGIFICVIFWFLLRSYKQLNTGKFNVIHEIEQGLPLALYKHEWNVLGEGKDYNIYYPFSHIELFIPWAFGAIYLVLAVVFITQ